MEGLKPPKCLNTTHPDMSTEWRNWVRQFEFYSIATGLNTKEEKIQIATLMTCIGPSAYKVYETFKMKDDDKMTAQKLKEEFSNYFTPKVNVTYERYLFNKIVQKQNESFDDFLTNCKSQIIKCVFENLEDELLKDKIVIGILSDKIRERLLSEEKLTLQKAINLCHANEIAHKQASSMHNSENIEISDVRKSQNKMTANNYSNKKTDNNNFVCARCNNSHGPKNCPAFGKICLKCRKKGHFAIVCQSIIKKVNKISEILESDRHNELSDESSDEMIVSSINASNTNSWFQKVKINNMEIDFKLDTGAMCNVLNLNLVKKLKGQISRSNTKKLVTYSGHKIDVLGQVLFDCIVKNKSYGIIFNIVNENTCPVLGMNTCEELNLVTRNIIDVCEIDDDIYKGLGCIKNFVYDIDLKPNAEFDIAQARRVPHAIRAEVKSELDKMVKLGVIAPIKEPSLAVSPMVVVRKKGKIRICIDPSQINKSVLRRHYPLKTIDEITTRIRNSKYFTKLDCKKGFWQIQVSKRTQKYLSFSTIWGRYTCLRLPFGLASAPEVFQQIMSNLLDGLNNVECSMDDILIHAETIEELKAHTDEVMQILSRNGLRLNREKCLFNQVKIKFLGHIISKEGLEIDESKTEAIKRLQRPKNVKQLQRFLGMVTYVGKFIPNYSRITAPLRELLQKDIQFCWDQAQEEAYTEIQNLLVSPPVLKFYDVNKDVKISCDASNKAVGAVLMQDEHPIAYSSRALTQAEQNYPQIEKEATAIRHAVKKFHEYIYGKKLTIETDHKPLESIFKKQLHSAPARLQRILLETIQYNPIVVYTKGKEIPIADTLSRDCLNDNPENQDEPEVQIIIPMTNTALESLQKDTEDDVQLNRLMQLIQSGELTDKSKLSPEIKHFSNFAEELAVYHGIIFKGEKIVIPKSQISKILTAAHTGHLGIQSTMKRVRQIFYWKNLTNDVISFVDSCAICQQTQRQNIKEPIISKEVPELPFQIVATDLFNFASETYIALVDSYSGFMDMEKLEESTSHSVIQFLKKCFAIHGTPQVVESDNGPQYTSREFKDFIQKWNFIHKTSSPHFPRANGLAERTVQTLKNMLRKCEKDNTDIYQALQNLRNTPRDSNLESPNQRLMSRTTRTHIPISHELLKPRIIVGVTENLKSLRNQQKSYADRNTKTAVEPKINEKIRLQIKKREWVPGKVIRRLDEPRSVIVKTEDNKLYRRNFHHIHPTKANININRENDPIITTSSQDENLSNMESNIAHNNTTNSVDQRSTVTSKYHTRSGRLVKQPVRLNL